MPKGQTGTKQCELCKKDVSLFAYNRHVKAHSKPKQRSKWPDLKCPFCGKQCKNNLSISNHVVRCPANPDRSISVMTEEGKARSIAASKARIWTPEQRESHSIIMKKVVSQNPDSYTVNNVVGRVAAESYNGQKFHGKWEVEVAKWLDCNKVAWTRDLQPFPYFWNESWHLYFPDFYLPDFDLYIEVKGYERERDRCKWAVVPNIVVMKQKEINDIRKGQLTPSEILG